MGKRKGSRIKSLKTKLTNIFSLYIRALWADNNGDCACVTCGRKLKWRNEKHSLQAGHFIPVYGSPMLQYDERNVHPQCNICNGSREGCQWRYGLYIINTYGKAELDRLLSLDMIKFKFTEQWLLEKIEEYTKKFEHIKNMKCLK